MKERFYGFCLVPQSIFGYRHKDRLLFDLMIELSHLAVYQNETDTPLKLKKGQLVTSDRELAGLLFHHNPSHQTIARKLNKLAKMGLIDVERRKYIGTLITVRVIAGTGNEPQVGPHVGPLSEPREHKDNNCLPSLTSHSVDHRTATKQESYEYLNNLKSKYSYSHTTNLNPPTVSEMPPEKSGLVVLTGNVFPIDGERISQAEEVLAVFQDKFPTPSADTRKKFIDRFVKEKSSVQKFIEYIEVMAGDRSFGGTNSPMRLFHFESTVKPIRDMVLKKASDMFKWRHDIETTVDSLLMDGSIADHFALDLEGLTITVQQIAIKIEREGLERL